MTTPAIPTTTPPKPKSPGDILTPLEVEADYRIPVSTQYVWRCNNRYGWRDLGIKLGRKLAYRREDIENWLNARTGTVA